MKKLLTLLLAVALLTVLLPALAQVDTSEPVVITYLVTGDIPTNKTNETLEILNQKLKEKVNATLALEWIEWTDWTTKYNLALATQDGSIDLVGTATDWLNAWPNIQKGAFLPLSEEMLKTYAPKTWASVPQENWELCKYNDQIYLMPEDHFAQWTNHGFMYRGDWAKEAGLENYVTSWADLGTYFQYVKDNKEGVIPWDADGNGTSYGPQMSGGWQTSHTSNIYIEGLSVDLFYGESKENPYKLSRYYLEGDEFVNFAKNQKAWSDAGYWREDVLNYSGSVMDEMKEGLTGANQHHTQTWISQRHLLEEKQPGADLQFFWFGREMNNVVKLNITHGAMAVASKSKSPERALMVYDLMRNDPEIYRLLTLGVEGVQYELTEDGLWKRPASYVDDSVDGSGFNYWWGRNDDLEVRNAQTDWAAYDLLMEQYKDAINYPYGQVVFDTFNISSELDNLSNIYNTYMPQIVFGKAEDPEAYVAEFREQLKAAGYERCLEEVQRQLDEVYGK